MGGNPDLLARRLSELRPITQTDAGQATVGFDVDYGEYDALPSDILKLLAEYGATLYSDDACHLDYTAVL